MAQASALQNTHNKWTTGNYCMLNQGEVNKLEHGKQQGNSAS